MCMRVVTWNMNYWKRPATHAEAWDFVLNELRPDIALVQEAAVPDGTGYEVLSTKAVDRGTLKESVWGSAILSRVGKPETKVALSAADVAARGAVQIASCAIAGLGTTTLANIHSRLGEGTVKVIPNLRRTFEIIMCELQDRFIVGGDLNTGRLLGRVYPKEYLHAAFWDEVDRSKLKESLPGGLEERQSYWGHGNDNKGPTRDMLQDDHLFFDAETIQQVGECRVWDTKKVRALSDHGPVVADLNCLHVGDGQ